MTRTGRYDGLRLLSNVGCTNRIDRDGLCERTNM